MNKPYTYLLEWCDGVRYYGVRYAKNCDPSDLFETYFTSSKYVLSRLENGNYPVKTQVRKIFETSDKAIDWEFRVLRRINAARRDDYLNKAYGGKVNTQDSEVRAKISETVKARWADGTYDGIFSDRDNSGSKNGMFGKDVKDLMSKEANDERLKKISKAISGRIISEEHRKNHSEYAKKRRWIVNRSGDIKHCFSDDDPRIKSGDFIFGLKWKENS